MTPFRSSLNAQYHGEDTADRSCSVSVLPVWQPSQTQVSIRGPHAGLMAGSGNGRCGKLAGRLNLDSRCSTTWDLHSFVRPWNPTTHVSRGCMPVDLAQRTPNSHSICKRGFRCLGLVSPGKAVTAVDATWQTDGMAVPLYVGWK